MLLSSLRRVLSDALSPSKSNIFSQKIDHSTTLIYRGHIYIKVVQCVRSKIASFVNGNSKWDTLYLYVSHTYVVCSNIVCRNKSPFTVKRTQLVGFTCKKEMGIFCMVFYY